MACEFSGIVRRAFLARGHEAWSCDIEPAEDDSFNHKQDDIRNILYRDANLWKPWDLLIAFPPCTHLCSSGAQYWPEKRKDGRQQAAIELFMDLANWEGPSCIENPVGIMSREFRKPDQIVNPFQFGDPYLKKTCLWLKGLPALRPTNVVEPIAHWHGGVRRGGKKADGTRTASKLPTALKYGERERSRTFQGIADAMAEQWGN